MRDNGDWGAYVSGILAAALSVGFFLYGKKIGAKIADGGAVPTAQYVNLDTDPLIDHVSVWVYRDIEENGAADPWVCHITNPQFKYEGRGDGKTAGEAILNARASYQKVVANICSQADVLNK